MEGGKIIGCVVLLRLPAFPTRGAVLYGRCNSRKKTCRMIIKPINQSYPPHRFTPSNFPPHVSNPSTHLVLPSKFPARTHEQIPIPFPTFPPYTHNIPATRKRPLKPLHPCAPPPIGHCPRTPAGNLRAGNPCFGAHRKVHYGRDM